MGPTKVLISYKLEDYNNTKNFANQLKLILNVGEWVEWEVRIHTWNVIGAINKQY